MMNDVAWGYQDNVPKTREDRVAEFNRACGKLTFKQGSIARYLELDIFMEEVKEFKAAMYDYVNNPDEPDLRANLVKEWADLQVTLSNLAWFFDIHGEKAFNRVADNNMTKIGTDGKVKRRADGKILKPDGYKYPDMRGL